MTLLLIGMSVIMLTTLTGGWLARKLGQSRVIGEIVGGILLGPSVFGKLAPNAADFLFPASSFATFEILSMAGLILFMFLVGMGLDYELLYRQRKTALHRCPAAVCNGCGVGASVAAPFCCSGNRQRFFCVTQGVTIRVNTTTKV